MAIETGDIVSYRKYLYRVTEIDTVDTSGRRRLKVRRLTNTDGMVQKRKTHFFYWDNWVSKITPEEIEETYNKRIVGLMHAKRELLNPTD